MYQFVVNFIGTLPEEFTFIYTILTLALSLLFFSVFVNVFYWVLHLIRGVA